MSTRNRPFKKKYSFLRSWDRVREKTDLENLNQLADIVETSNSNITKRKKEDNFPIEWAFEVAQRYGLTTEWILTGKGSPALEAKDNFFHDLEKWGQEIGDSENITWLKNQIEEILPAFKKWREDKNKSKDYEVQGGVKKQANDGGWY